MARAVKSADEDDQAATDLINRLDALDAIQLGRVIQAAQDQRAAKIKDAREALIARVREEAAALDLKPEDLFGRVAATRKPSSATRPRGKGTVPAQFRGPDGETWSGRGRLPVWLTALEAQGRRREEFRIRESQPDLIEQADRKR